MTSSLHIDSRREGDTHKIAIRGVVDEDAELGALHGLRGKVELNLRGLHRFNSVGTRAWVDAMRTLARTASLVFVECSPAVVFQLNMISGFLAGGRVESFIAPMRCERCERELDQLVTTDECRALDGLPPVACPGCRQPMELDELEDNYLLFIREPTVVGG